MMDAMTVCQSINKDDLDLLFSLHPVLAKKKEERAFALWLIKGMAMIDRESGRRIIPHTFLQQFVAKGKTGAFLGEMQQVFPDFRYQSHWYEGQKCRAVLDPGLEPVLAEILYHAPAHERFSGRTLKRIRKYQEQQVWRTAREEAKQVRWLYPDQQLIADYLHSRQIKPFLDMREQTFSDAWAIALARKDGGNQLRALQSWYDDPFPRYYPTGKTPRIFGTAAQFLASEIRKVLFAGCHELDLQNCQLAIVGGLLGVRSVQEKMSTGIPVWPDLLSHLGIPAHLWKVAKPFVKVALYSTVYGMNEKAVEAILKRDLLARGIEPTQTFLSHHLMQEVVSALAHAKAQIVKHGGMESAYGWMSWQGEELNSFLSIVIQSYETAIIATCYEVATKDQENNDRRCTILLHQHDGITVKLAPGIELASVLPRMQKAVTTKAATWNIMTTITA